ncbi:MAG: type VI secretion protein IcmF/TssM N-terminal domain-containing protein [Pikeienuella sp.]|uniref:type VI secretion protein IcmF/TssM N-terminal domain-containing protein n=1 Tax=Pikeienuella sp. TaxID=2831957 RepID=UPI00391C3CDB
MSGLEGNLGWIALALLVLLVFWVLLTWFFARRALAAPAAAAEGEAAPARSPAEVRRGFSGLAREVRARIAAFVGVRGAKQEETMLALLVGTEGAGADALAEAAAWRTPTRLSAPARPPTDMGEFALHLTPDGAIANFHDGLFALKDWRKTWRAALEGLRAERPDAPLDALVIAVRAGVLTSLEADAPERLEALGRVFEELFEDVLSVTGLTVPVYFVATHADADRGLAALAEIVGRDEEARGALLGWSAPNGAGPGCDPKAVEEAAKKTVEALDAAVLAHFGASAGRGGDPLSALRLVGASAAARALAAPLRRLLASAFRSSTFAEPMILRGIYLTGQATDERGALFAHDVFARKALREKGLARPGQGGRTSAATWARNCRRATAGVALVGVAALVWLGQSLFEQRPLGELLDQIESAAREHRRLALSGQAPSQADLLAETRGLYARMSEFRFDTINTGFAPTSYLSGLEERSERAIAFGFGDIILRAIRRGLEERFDTAQRAGEAALQKEERAGGGTLDRASPEAFQAYASRLDDVMNQVRTLEALPGSRSPEKLVDLSRYAIEVEPPTGFSKDYQVYIRALSYPEAQPRPFDRAGRREAVRLTAEAYAARAYAASPLYSAVREIERTSRSLAAGEVSAEALDRLLDHIILADRLLATDEATGPSETNWIGRRLDRAGAEPSHAPVVKALRGIENLGILASEEVDALWRTAIAAHQAAERDLLEMTGFDRSPILVQGTSGRAALAPEYLALIAPLRRFLTAARLADSAPVDDRSLAEGRFSWSPGPLEEAAGHINWLRSEFPAAAAALPGELRAALLVALERRISAKVLGLLARARSPLGPPGFGVDPARTEARGFAEAAPLLVAIRDGAALSRLDAVTDRLETVVGPQARRILDDADRALAQADIYGLYYPQVAAWNGAPNSAARLFGVSGAAALIGVTRDWRAFVELLSAERASAAIDYLARVGSGDPAESGPVARWSEIRSTLADYALRSPVNALSTLERFVLADLDGLTGETCEETLLSAQPGGGYFGERMEEMIYTLRNRCADLGFESATEAADLVAEAFTQALAGRFPFIGVGGAAPLDDPRRAQNFVEPEAVRRFFAGFGPQIEAIAASPAVRPDIAELDQARQFFAASGADVSTGGIAYAVEIDFNANRSVSRGAEQIIEWTLQIADRSLSSFEPPRPLIWRQGDPVRLSMRWARNAPQKPASPARPDAQIEERTITLSYDGPWSLVALIAANAMSGPEQRGLPDRLPNPLRLIVPLEPNPEAVATAEPAALTATPRETSAVLHLRIGLRALDAAGSAPVGPNLTLPVFPAQALYP